MQSFLHNGLKVGSLEGMLESLPQYFILTTLAITKGGLQSCAMGGIPMISTVEPNYSNVTCSESQHLMSNVSYYQTFGLSSNIFGFHIPQYYSFRWSYNLTVISCTFGLLRFLDVGPTRILENDGWRNYAGYGIAFISVFFSLYTKALGLGTGGYMMNTIIDQFNLCKLIMS